MTWSHIGTDGVGKLSAWTGCMKAASVLDYREVGRRPLPHFLFEYIDGGSYALAANGEARVAHMLRPMEAEMRIALALTGMVSVTDINTNIFMNTRRDVIQQE